MANPTYDKQLEIKAAAEALAALISGGSLKVTVTSGSAAIGTVAQGAAAPANAGWPVTPGTGTTWDVGDRAARALGVVSLPTLAPPTGGEIVGDNAAHAFGALTGPAVLVVSASGGTARIGPAATVSATVGLPIVDGASYDAGGRQYAAIEATKVYVPIGCTVVWGAHQ